MQYSEFTLTVVLSRQLLSVLIDMFGLGGIDLRQSKYGTFASTCTTRCCEHVKHAAVVHVN